MYKLTLCENLSLKLALRLGPNQSPQLQILARWLQLCLKKVKPIHFIKNSTKELTKLHKYEGWSTSLFCHYRKFSKISNTSCLPKRPRQTVQTQIRLLFQKQSDQSLRCCYSEKHFVNSIPENQHFSWEQKENVFEILEHCLTKTGFQAAKPKFDYCINFHAPIHIHIHITGNNDTSILIQQ